MSRRLALLIGNARYQDGRLHVPVPGKSFTALADALEQPAGRHFDELFVLLNKPSAEVQVAIAEFLELSRSADDFLFLYFAGHALYHQKRPYLACWDTFSGSYLDGTTIQADYIRRRLSLHPAKQKMVVLDCTVSPLLASDELPTGPWLANAFQATGVHVLAGARPYPADGAPTPSPLTPALIDNLQAGQAVLTAVNAASVMNQLKAAEPQPVVETAVVEPELAVVIASSEPVELPLVDEPESPTAVVEAETAVEEAVLAVVADDPPQESPTSDEIEADSEVVAEESVADELAVEDAAPLDVASRQTDTAVADDALTAVVEPEASPAPNEEVESALAKRWLVPLAALLFLLALAVWYGPRWLADESALPTQVVAAVLPTDEPTATAVRPTISPTAEPLAAPTEPTHSETGTAVATEVMAQTATATVRATVTPSPTAESTAVVGGHVARQLINLRAGPATNYRIVDRLAEGTTITVLGRTESGEWYNIQLADGRTGWVFSEMVQALTDDAEEIEVVATIPVPQNEFYDLVARPTADGLTVRVGHLYVGTHGPEGLFTAVLLPETTIVQPTYENGQALGLGEFEVRFTRVGEGEYTSTTLKLCMVSTAGLEFFCETYPALKEW